jgi:hypothetical protein
MQPVIKHRLHTAIFLFICIVITANNIFGMGIDYTRVGYRTTTVFSEDDQNRWRIGESYAEARFTTDAFGLQMGFNIAHSRPDGDLRWGYNKEVLSLSDIGDANNGKLSGRMFFQEPYIQTVFSLTTPGNKFSTSLGWRHKNRERQEFSGEVWFQPFQTLGAGGKLSKAYPIPVYSELFYTYRNNDVLAREGGKLNWCAPAYITEFKLLFSPLERISVESIIQETNFKPETPTNGESPHGTYLGVFDGLWYDSRITTRYMIKPQWRITLEYRQMGAHARLRLYDGGQKFGHFGVIKADTRYWSLKTKYNNWYMNFRTGSGEGELKGVLEAWPFVEGLLQFLGERRHFVGVADINWKAASFGGRLFDFRRIYLNASLDYLNITPDMRYATWRPKAFGMGFDDLKGGHLDLARADLIRLVLKPVLRFNRWRVEFDISQWIPLLTEKFDTEQSSSPSPEPSPESAKTSDKKKNIWGGFTAVVSLKAEF